MSAPSSQAAPSEFAPSEFAPSETKPSPGQAPLIDVNHDDGDIVLAAGERADVVEETFRVHRAIICLHSPVFRDLLSNANPDEIVEGCPVIRCLDSVSDIRVLLSALYNGLAIQRNSHLTLDDALSILRLSDKYRIEGLQAGITRVLQEDWPLNYKDYLNRQKLLGSPGCRVLDSMKIIKTAQLCGADTLLPAAFFELASTPNLEASQQYLSWKDMDRLLTGREHSARRLRSLVWWNEESVPTYWIRDLTAVPITIFQTRTSMADCSWNHNYREGSHYCHGLFTALVTEVGRKLLEGSPPPCILRELERSRFTDACPPCIDWLFTSVLPNKELEMWENIPVDFDLPRINNDLYAATMFRTL